MTDLEFIAALRRQDDGSTEQLFDHYGNEIYSLIYKMTNSEDLSKSLTIKTFESFGQQKFQFDPKSQSIFSFLIGSARRIVTKAKAEDDNLSSVELESDSGHQDLVNANYTQIMDQLFLRGQSLQDIAKKLRVPVSTGRTRFRLAINALKKKYNSEVGSFLSMLIATTIIYL